MIRQFLPAAFNHYLFGSRALYGKTPDFEDPDWIKWQQNYTDIYFDTQKSGAVARYINQKGYDVLSTIDFTEKLVGEIGPGGGYHLPLIEQVMREYHAFDVNSKFLNEVETKAQSVSKAFQGHLVSSSSTRLQIKDNYFDHFLAFYSLEHLNPLDDWLSEIFRTLKPGGTLIASIPTEGGLLWGMGRALTSRKIIEQKYGIDLDKIVCWEHPNFCDDVIAGLADHGELTFSNWPTPFLPADFNLLQNILVVKNA